MKRKKKKSRRGKPKTQTRMRTTAQVLEREQMSIRGEVDYIVRRAQERIATIVTMGPLLFFSTESGDAWMLDPADGDALCLARDGDPRPVSIAEDETQFKIGWQSKYRIEGDLFQYATPTGFATIIGYPTREIQKRISAVW